LEERNPSTKEGVRISKRMPRTNVRFAKESDLQHPHHLSAKTHYLNQSSVANNGVVAELLEMLLDTISLNIC
jgi:hypothetical protein